MFRDCIREIVKTAGIEVLNDPARFKAYVGDLASEYPKERNFVVSSDDKYFQYFADAKDNKDKLENAAIQASQYLVKQKHIDHEWSEYISGEIKEGLCIIHGEAKKETDTNDKIEEDKSVYNEAEDSDKQDEKTQHNDNRVDDNSVDQSIKGEETKNSDKSKAYKRFLVPGLIIIAVIFNIVIIGSSVSRLINTGSDTESDPGYESELDVKESELRDAIRDAISDRNANMTSYLIDSYDQKDDASELDRYVVDEFRNMGNTLQYSNFTYMQKVVKELQREDIKGDLQDVLNQSQPNKVKAFLKGNWICRDLSGRDGMIISISWDDYTGKAKIKKTISGSFKKGSTKWDDISIVTAKKISFNDFFSGSKHPATGKVNFKNNQITCRAEDDNSTQVWIKKNKIKKKKEVLKDSDFIFENGDLRKDPNTFWSNSCDKGDYGLYLPRNSYLYMRKDVIKHFSYGRIIYQSYKNDPFYKAAYNDSDKGWVNFANAVKRSKYSAVYFDKGKNWFIRMYFDKKDRFIAWIIANKNYYSVK